MQHIALVIGMSVNIYVIVRYPCLLEVVTLDLIKITHTEIRHMVLLNYKCLMSSYFAFVTIYLVLRMVHGIICSKYSLN